MIPAQRKRLWTQYRAVTQELLDAQKVASEIDERREVLRMKLVEECEHPTEYVYVFTVANATRSGQTQRCMICRREWRGSRELTTEVD